MTYEHLCMNCMKDRGNKDQCPHCHFHTDTPQNPPFLPMRTILNETYLVGAVLETNGDGVTYMGLNTKTNTPVTLREFHPNRIATRRAGDNNLLPRSGRETEFEVLKREFIQLWDQLYQMQNLSSLVRTLDLFEENNTIYAVSEFVEGRQSLRDYLLSSKEGYLSWKTARILFMPLLSALSALHDVGIIHRGLSPTTIYVYPDNKLHIGGFCIADARIFNRGLSTEIFPGYTPAEQLGLAAATGPWSDIYSFAAVLYRALIGKAPIEANVRIEQDDLKIPAQFVESLPTYVIDALVDAMQIYPEDRIRNTEQLRLSLSGSQVEELKSEFRREEKERKRQMLNEAREREAAEQEARAAAMQEQEAAEAYEEEQLNKKPSSSKKKGNSGVIALVVALIALLVVFGVLLGTVFKDHINGYDSDEDTTESTVSATITVPDFAGQSASSVESTYGKQFNFEYSYENNDSYAKGQVISQSIQAGTTVNEGTTIKLVVSSGKEQITMPENLVGQTYESAEAKLEAAGFKVTRGDDRDNDGTHTAGTVASTSLTGGKQYDQGTECVVRVWGEDPGSTDTDTDTQNPLDPWGLLGHDDDSVE